MHICWKSRHDGDHDTAAKTGGPARRDLSVPRERLPRTEPLQLGSVLLAPHGLFSGQIELASKTRESRS